MWGDGGWNEAGAVVPTPSVSQGQDCSAGGFCRSLASSPAPEAPEPHYSAFNSSKGADLTLEPKLPLPWHPVAKKGTLGPSGLQTRRVEPQGQRWEHFPFWDP